MYFFPGKKDPKLEGDKHFKRVCRDSGWKGAKIVKIRKQVKAVDPPLTKAQKDALRQRAKSDKSANTRRTRGDRNNKPKSRKVPQDVPSTSLSRLLETGPTRTKVSKDKLPKNGGGSGKTRTRKTTKNKP